MKKLAILLGVFALAGVILAVWLVKVGSSELKTESDPKKVLTALPTSPPKPASPTATPVINKSGSMFVTITAPTEGTKINSATVTVKGVTLPGADIGVNDKDVIADKKGNFTATVAIDEGENEIEIIATDEAGNFAEQILLVTRE